jgi:hypothetical protein
MEVCGWLETPAALLLVPLCRMLSVSQIQSGSGGEEKISRSLPGIPLSYPGSSVIQSSLVKYIFKWYLIIRKWRIYQFGLDDRGSRVRFPGRGMMGILFTTASRTALGPTQLPILWVPGALSLGVELLGSESDHSPPSSAEVKEWSYTSTPQYAFMAWCLVKQRAT